MRASVGLFVGVLVSALGLQLFAPWWLVVGVGLAAGLVSPCSPGRTGLLVAGAVALGGLGMAGYVALTTSTVLLPRVATLLQLPAPWTLYPLTALVGALPAGLAALGGALLQPRSRTTQEEAHGS
ncbi:MAG: hypothetical protein GVY15_12475 [Bacteroidetes bacterium]|jgi:hypothetical protein|nr:hypothetical protein [Bacteroidota bacterium]